MGGWSHWVNSNKLCEGHLMWPEKGPPEGRVGRERREVERLGVGPLTLAPQV